MEVLIGQSLISGPFSTMFEYRRVPQESDSHGDSFCDWPIQGIQGLGDKMEQIGMKHLTAMGIALKTLTVITQTVPSPQS